MSYDLLTFIITWFNTPVVWYSNNTNRLGLSDQTACWNTDAQSQKAVSAYFTSKHADTGFGSIINRSHSDHIPRVKLHYLCFTQWLLVNGGTHWIWHTGLFVRDGIKNAQIDLFVTFQGFRWYCSLNLYSAGTVFRRQNLTSMDVRIWRLKMAPQWKN